MFKLKHSIAVVALAANSTALFAGSMGPACIPGTLTTPCERNAWSFGAQALYLRPSFGGNGLGYSAFSFGSDVFGNFVGVNSDINRISNMTPKWGWGFQLEGDYHYGMGNDINVNWYHFNNTTDGYFPYSSVFAGSASNLYGGFFQVEPTWDAVNLEFGQRIDINNANVLRFHVGAEFARIKAEFTNYPRLVPFAEPLFVTTDSISYSGFGPRAGGDFSYFFREGLSVYAKGAGSLLVGTAKQHVIGYRNYTFVGSLFPYSTGNYSQSTNGVVIPELEAKLGIKYDYLIAQGVLGFDLGYMWVDYLNALVSQTGSGIVSSAISTSTAANFSLNGLYFGMKWTGNI